MAQFYVYTEKIVPLCARVLILSLIEQFLAGHCYVGFSSTAGRKILLIRQHRFGNCGNKLMRVKEKKSFFSWTSI